jgi:hypothetical protein
MMEAMTPEHVLAIKPKILTQAQREAYFNDGFLLVERAIGEEWLRKLRAATDELVERSRKVTKSDAIFDLEPTHRADAPRLRRVSNPVEQHPLFWDYCVNSVMADIVADLVGPDVKFHHSKLNFKWKSGGEEVKWHYDISFWPHTNYSPLTVGTYLYDCGMEQAPLAVMPGSHRIEPMLSQYDANGNWTGCSTSSAASVPPGRTMIRGHASCHRTGRRAIRRSSPCSRKRKPRSPARLPYARSASVGAVRRCGQRRVPCSPGPHSPNCS